MLLVDDGPHTGLLIGLLVLVALTSIAMLVYGAWGAVVTYRGARPDATERARTKALVVGAIDLLLVVSTAFAPEGVQPTVAPAVVHGVAWWIGRSRRPSPSSLPPPPPPPLVGP